MPWITNTVKHSTGSSTQVQETPQATSVKTEQMQGPPLQLPQPELELPIESRIRDSGVAGKKDRGGNMDMLSKQRPVPTVGDKTPVQQKAQSGEISYASMIAAPVSKRQAEDSVGIPRETNNKRTGPQRIVVGGLNHSDARSRGPAQRSSGGDQRSPRVNRNPTELVELQKKLASCVQEKDAMMKDRDSTQRKLADAEKRNRDLEEQNKRQSGQLQTITGNLRQAEDLHRQTLDLLEVRTSELKSAQAFLSNEDSLSGADLIGMVDALNAEILQVAAFIVDSLESLVKAPKSAADRGSAPQTKSVVDLGKHIIGALRSGLGHAEFDPLLVQVALQVCLVSVSSWLIRSWIPGYWKYDRMFSEVHADIQTVEGQAISRRWRAITCGRLKQYWKRFEKNMMAFVSDEITSVLVLAGQRRSSIEGKFMNKFHDRLDIIVQSALRINEATHVDITSKDLQILVISPGATFDTRSMDDAFSEGEVSKKKRAAEEHGQVAGTTDIGILSLTGNTPVREILKKPKVVLVSTLREGYHLKV